MPRSAETSLPCGSRAAYLFSIPENISGEILKAVQSIYPMQNVYIRKVKALKKPKFDREYPQLRFVWQSHKFTQRGACHPPNVENTRLHDCRQLVGVDRPARLVSKCGWDVRCMP